MTKLGRRLIAAAKENLSQVKEYDQRKVLQNWDMGQARTCLVCGEVFLTKKYLRLHRANHRKVMERTCEKTATT